MIPVGGVLQAWAITVYGHGTLIEDDEKMADIKARHFESVGGHVTITELGPVVPADTVNVLLWNELTPGDYWVFDMIESFIEQEPRPGFACVYIDSDDLFICHDSGDHKLDSTFARYQFVKAERPQRSEINFKPVLSDTGHVRPDKYEDRSND